MNPRQCRWTFHLDRPECRACAGYDTSCPDYEPIRPEKEPRNKRSTAAPEAALRGAAVGCRPVRARRTQLRFA